ncbi:hypothetical protein N1851_001735 [Merluccius polli]|uniref:Integrase core domain-containing protein n=1 Tax=Merluccius polli TaxID=89951 RepID=A0AA47ND17_MERPO|nr:hypothetical protein N1851_001735 [Merluccius polli]
MLTWPGICLVFEEQVEGASLWVEVSTIKGLSVCGQMLIELCLIFQQLFQYLQQTGVLDSTNEAHIWALHYVFLERIQRSWNHHRLSSAQSSSPLALRHTGMLSQFDLADVMQVEIKAYGVDYGIPVIENNSVGINVPESNFIVNSEQLAEL